MVSVLLGKADMTRASIWPSEAKARKPYDKTEFRTEFSG